MDSNNRENSSIWFRLSLIAAAVVAGWFAIFWKTSPEVLSAQTISAKYELAIILKQFTGVAIPFILIALGYIFANYDGVRIRLLWMVSVTTGLLLAVVMVVVYKVFNISFIYDAVMPVLRNSYAPVTGVAIGAVFLPAIKRFVADMGKRAFYGATILVLVVPAVFNKDVFLFNGGNSLWFGFYCFIIGVGLFEYHQRRGLIYTGLQTTLMILMGALATVLMTHISSVNYDDMSASVRFVSYSSIFSVLTAISAVQFFTVGADRRTRNISWDLTIGFVGLMIGTGDWLATGSLGIINSFNLVGTKATAVIALLLAAGLLLIGVATATASERLYSRLTEFKIWSFGSLSEAIKFILSGVKHGLKVVRSRLALFSMLIWMLLLSALSIIGSNFSWQIVPTAKSENLILYVLFDRFSIILLTFLVVLSIFFVILAVTTRYWVSVNLTTIIVVGFVVVNRLKSAARQEPLLPSDLSMIKAFPSLLGMVSIPFIVATVIVMVLVVLLTVWLERAHPVHMGTWKLRVLALVLPLLMTGFVSRMNHTGGVSSTIAIGMGDGPRFYNQLAGAENNGAVMQFLNNVDMTAMNEPQGYSKAAMMRIKSEYVAEAKKLNKARANDFAKQTIILNLSESFADPTRVPNLSLNKDPIPYIRSLKRQTTAGVMMSSGYGGGTANMEYASLTSLDLAAFAPSLSTPFTQLPFTNSYGPSIAKLFTDTSGIHPNTALYYRRIHDYPKLGIKKFYYLGSKYKIKHQKKIENSPYLSDETAYDNAELRINSTQSGQFINLVTMQNHYPYSDHYYTNKGFEASGSALSSNTDTDEVEQFATGLSYTDTAVKKFIKEIDNINKPITFIWYGDHLPGGIYDGLDVTKNNVALHETDYFIYSNKYAREHEGAAKKLNYSVTDPSQFTSLAMMQTNSKVSAYYAMMNDVTKKLPAMSVNLNATESDTNRALMVNEQGKQVNASSLSAKQKKLLRDYKLIQYDTVSGKHYLGDDFFTKIIK